MGEIVISYELFTSIRQLEQIANEFTKTESGPCFDKLSTNGWILGVAVKTVHPEPVEG